jgi:hypothetical protein
VFLNTQEHVIVMYTLTTKHDERLAAASCTSQIDDGTSEAVPPEGQQHPLGGQRMLNDG